MYVRSNTHYPRLLMPLLTDMRSFSFVSVFLKVAADLSGLLFLFTCTVMYIHVHVYACTHGWCWTDCVAELWHPGQCQNLYKNPVVFVTLPTLMRALDGCISYV